jgi:hypothetical protein
VQVSDRVRGCWPYSHRLAPLQQIPNGGPRREASSMRWAQLSCGMRTCPSGRGCSGWNRSALHTQHAPLCRPLCLCRVAAPRRSARHDAVILEPATCVERHKTNRPLGWQLWRSYTPQRFPTSHISLFRSDTVPHCLRCSRPRPLEPGSALPHLHGVQQFPAPRPLPDRHSLPPPRAPTTCTHPGPLLRPRVPQVARGQSHASRQLSATSPSRLGVVPAGPGEGLQSANKVFGAPTTLLLHQSQTSSYGPGADQGHRALFSYLDRYWHLQGPSIAPIGLQTRVLLSLCPTGLLLHSSLRVTYLVARLNRFPSPLHAFGAIR